MKIFNISIKPLRLPITLFMFLLATILCIFLTNINTINMNSENFSKLLKDCHDSPYKYENKKIKMVGYVFRASDFEANQFVIARDMLINENESRIIGFLCESNDSYKFKDNEWVCATGTITVGEYHGIMPIIKIKKLEPCKVPEQIWVFPPNNFNLNKMIND